VALLDLALTHRSQSAANYERLEFLGDATLGYVISEWLYKAFPRSPESELHDMRVAIVQQRTLAVVAREIDLGQHLRLGPGVRSSGGHRNESILADTLEAIIGAVLQDGGIESARTVIGRLFSSHLERADPGLGKDAKTELQEWLQARGMALPRYSVRAQTGDDHAPRFEVACIVDALGVEAVAEGSSRREAEKLAARRVLDRIVSHADG
jgi:ribonuclease III